MRRDRPRLLDLFCKAGGAGKGYADAGFEVVGVDIEPQPRYPFEFIQADALTFPLDWFDAVHASPPCQAHSAMAVMWNAGTHPDLIEPIRKRLIAAGLPYVIENVVGAPLDHPVRICGAALGLGTSTHQLARHRLFETNFPVMVPPCAHGQRPTLGIYGDHARDRRRSIRIGYGQMGAADGLAAARQSMGIDWMNWREISQAIPPAYTEHIGHYLMAEINARAVA
jgi:DNA (cytosine-5)-methyltransferase 1